MAKVLVHEFLLSDSDDPEIYAAQPIYEWKKTEAGAWIMKHSKPEPYWTLGFHHETYSHRVRITANLTDEEQTFFQLKYGHQRK